MRKMILISKIKPNPWRDLKCNPLVPERIEAIAESIDTTSFWVGVYGREVEGGFVELAFGHHRLESAKESGLKEIPIEIEKFTDGEMLMWMARENVRGERPIMLEAITAAVRALAEGKIELEELDPKTRKDAIRYAPSYIPGKLPSDTAAVSHAYTADSLARFLGYIKRASKTAKNSVVAALGLLEMEERKLIKRDSVAKVPETELIQIVSDIKKREVKVIERREKTAEEIAALDKEQREIQAERKRISDNADEDRKKLVEKLAKAKAEKDKPKIEAIKAVIVEKEAMAVEKDLDLKVRSAELDKKVEERKEKEAEAKKEDAYLPIKHEVERILRKLLGDTATTKESLAEEAKALGRKPLNATDRERLRQAALNYGTWFCEWVAQQFIPPLTSNKSMNEYRRKEAANRRRAEAEAEREQEKAERKAKKEKDAERKR